MNSSSSAERCGPGLGPWQVMLIVFVWTPPALRASVVCLSAWSCLNPPKTEAKQKCSLTNNPSRMSLPLSNSAN